MTQAYRQNLDQNPANHQPLTPVSFLARSAAVFPEKAAIIHGDQTWSYATFFSRARRLASALSRAGVQAGQTVSALLFNTPPMLDAHYGVPMIGGVLNALNTRLDAAGIAFILDHGESQFVLVDSELAPLMREALDLMTGPRPPVVEYTDPTVDVAPLGLGTDYEDFLEMGDPDFVWQMPGDEWDAIALNYTSGTTGNPKGVVYHHRGAYLLATGNAVHAGLQGNTVYLWTLPMFHCNGWCFPWSISLVGGTHVCLRAVRAGAIYDAIVRHGVTHLCGAPIVMSTLLAAGPEEIQEIGRRITFWTAAAPPPEAVLAAMAEAGFDVTHVYGLTEVYGPSVINEWKSEWDQLPPDEQARLKARQGVNYQQLEGIDVMDPETMTPVPRDGETVGEIMLRGNVVMKGYLKNPVATREAFEGGWFHTGDLAVMHPDGYTQIKDRAKDVIISGGENISSIEVEDTLFKHPAVAMVAVVAKADEKWGETPCAFVELKPGMTATADDLIAFCRQNLARYKCPRHVVFEDLPKTSTGKVQKFELRKRTETVGESVSGAS